MCQSRTISDVWKQPYFARSLFCRINRRLTASLSGPVSPYLIRRGLRASTFSVGRGASFNRAMCASACDAEEKMVVVDEALRHQQIKRFAGQHPALLGARYQTPRETETRQFATSVRYHCKGQDNRLFSMSYRTASHASQLRHPSLSGSGSHASSQSSALQHRINEKRIELENLKQLRDLSGGLAGQMEQLEEKLSTLSNGTEGVANASMRQPQQY